MGEDAEIYRKKKRPNLEVSIQSLHSEIRMNWRQMVWRHQDSTGEASAKQCSWRLTEILHGFVTGPPHIWYVVDLVFGGYCWQWACGWFWHSACFGDSFPPWVCPTEWELLLVLCLVGISQGGLLFSGERQEEGMQSERRRWGKIWWSRGRATCAQVYCIREQ